MGSGLGNETVLQRALLPVAGTSQLASFQHAVPLACWSLVQLLSTLLFSVSYTQCKVVRPHVDEFSSLIPSLSEFCTASDEPAGPGNEARLFNGLGI